MHPFHPHYPRPDAPTSRWASSSRRCTRAPCILFAYIYASLLLHAIHFESARASAVRPDIAIPMCVSTSTIFRWYEASSFGLLSVKGNETLSTCGTHSAQHIYLYEFHSTHFPASLPPPHTSPNPLLFTAHTHLVKLSFRTPHRHVRIVFVAIHLPSITCF